MLKKLSKILVALTLVLAIGVAQAISLSQAVEQVRRDTNGKILSARTEVKGNREVHVIKVLTPEGRVRTIRVPGDPVKRGKPDAHSAD
ncbi:MAG: hypothetical protein R3200_11685 [Xanthomonadales bacterium]|nr:hypothetical protein [Xanthomonadales bacterium]